MNHLGATQLLATKLNNLLSLLVFQGGDQSAAALEGWLLSM